MAILLPRTIDKCGGLDNYLLKTKESKLNSDVGNEVKARILKAMAEKRGTPAAPP